ncbi:MAG TPA: murein L,D-transpeptidase catalytic domain family protein [Sphingomicrobium sp.]|nr:murein L,D-transpeptidase catalytic domain family protein [Sphingomicrobium sp.]
MLRLGACGAAGAIISSAASSSVLPSLVPAPQPVSPLPPAVVQPQPLTAPGGINPLLFAKAKAALDQHRIRARDWIGVVDFSLPSSERRFHVVDLRSGEVESFRVAHGHGSDRNHNGFLDRFSNEFGSYATSNGTYTTGDYYHGKYGLSMKTHGHDWSNYNAEPRAIVIHNAWYAEPGVLAAHGKLGRSQGCFAFSRADQWPVMRKLAGGRMIYADKLA